MARPVTVISSMATRLILRDLAETYRARIGASTSVTSVGGVEAARRIRAGEAFDVAVLAADAMDALAHDGCIAKETVRVLARSPTAVAVPIGAARPATADEPALRAMICGARRIGLSTGPSGATMGALLERWGMLGAGGRRIVRAPPGVPVARLLANGEADIGFQQLSELMGEPGIEIVGTMPEMLQPMTVFAIGLSPGAVGCAPARAIVEFLLSETAHPAIRQHGMVPPAA